MKKAFVWFIPFLWIVGLTVSAHATVFKVNGGSLNLSWDWGGGTVDYTAYSPSFSLDDGKSTDVTFGSISFPSAFGAGTATLGIDFQTPVFDGPVQDIASYFVISMDWASAGWMKFGNPETFSYNNKAGDLIIGLYDVYGIQKGSQVAIKGKVTNRIYSESVNSSVSVPDASIMFLLGPALLGLGILGRRKDLR